MPQPYVTATYRDRSGERSTVTIYLGDIAPDGSNYEDMIGGDPSSVTQIVNGIGLLTACTLVSYSVTIPIHVEENPATPPHWVHRENKMLITYSDEQNARKGSVEIPGPDTSVFPTDVGDNWNVQTLLNAMNNVSENDLPNNMVSRDGNAVIWQSAKLVGRNI